MIQIDAHLWEDETTIELSELSTHIVVLKIGVKGTREKVNLFIRDIKIAKEFQENFNKIVNILEGRVESEV